MFQTVITLGARAVTIEKTLDVYVCLLSWECAEWSGGAWSPLGWRWLVSAAAGASGHNITTNTDSDNTMIRALSTLLACVLVCHAKEANIKFISGPEVITDLGKYNNSGVLLRFQLSSLF